MMSPIETDTGRFSRLNAIRTILVIVMALGYASTMARGPQTLEYGAIFGYEPSWFAIQSLFFLSGFLALRSLERHGSASRMLWTRLRRNGPPLAVVTAIVAFLVYPWIQAPGGMGSMNVAELLSYFALTVSCADPGQVMPGALDDAHYACLLQGAIWTFRWGAIAYLGTALAWKFDLLNRRLLLLFGTIILTASFAMLHFVSEKTGLGPLDNLLVGMRLLHPFAIGMCAYAYRDHFPKRLYITAMWMLIPFAVAVINYHFLPWTPFIEIGAELSLFSAVLFAMHAKTPALNWLQNWPALALPLFILNWPIAQIWLYLRPDMSSMVLMVATLVSALAVSMAAVTVLGQARPAKLSPATA